MTNVQKNNLIDGTCAWNNHGAPALFVITNTEHNNWSSCALHTANMLMFMADLGPLTIEPIFSNFPRPGSPAWRYIILLGAQFGDGHDRHERETAAEIGPFTTAEHASTVAIDQLGRTVDDVLNDTSLATYVTAMTDQTGPGVIIGFTVERYDGEETDGSWSINGGLRAAFAQTV